MKLIALLLAAASPVLVVGPLAPSATPVTEPAHLEVFTPLIGKVWSASFPSGGLRDVQEFEWMFGGKFVRNVHRVCAPDGAVVYEGETIYGWDHQSERIRWWYFNATGGHVIGELTEIEGRLVAEGRNRGPDGQVGRVRSDLVIGEEDWTSTSFSLEGDEWREQFTMEFATEE